MMNIIEKIEAVKQCINNSNRLAQDLYDNTDFRFLEDVSIPWKRVEPSELGFIRVVSWLYVLYIDIKKNNKNIKFLMTEIKSTNHQNHIDNIMRLRTYFQHQITPSQNVRDKETQDLCNDFFEDIIGIGKTYPKDEDDWSDVLHKVLNDSLDITQQIVIGLETINSYFPTTKNITIQQWKKQIENTHDKYEFELVFKSTVTDMGLEILNSYTLTEQNLIQWRRSLEKLADGYDFKYELRKIIEQSLVEQLIPPPVSGGDFIDRGVPKGPILREAIKLARTIYYQNPCEKEALIIAVINALPH